MTTHKIPQIAIVFVNWNNKEFTISAINEVHKQTFQDYEIIVVDNDSEDNSQQEIKKKFPDSTLIQTGYNAGYAKGNAFGLEYAIKKKIPYTIFLNSDVFLEKDMLKHMYEYMQRHKKVGAVSPKIYYHKDPKKIWFIHGKFNRMTGRTPSDHQNLRDTGQFTKILQSDWIPGTAFMARTAILEQIGCFDERFFLYVEDVDLCQRIRSAGYTLAVLPKAILWHNESTTSGGRASAKIIYYYTRNTLLMMQKQSNKIFFVTSYLYSLFFCLRRFASHIIQRKLQKATIRATWFAFYDFHKGTFGKLSHNL